MNGRRSGGVRSLRPLGAAEIVWGATLLVGRRQLFSRLEGRAPDEPERVALGTLAARHLVQGALEVIVPHRFARLYAATEAIHASTMLLVAVFQPERRRVAVISGALAAASGWRAWRCR